MPLDRGWVGVKVDLLGQSLREGGSIKLALQSLVLSYPVLMHHLSVSPVYLYIALQVAMPEATVGRGAITRGVV